jgi:hypothetical protein
LAASNDGRETIVRAKLTVDAHKITTIYFKSVISAVGQMGSFVESFVKSLIMKERYEELFVISGVGHAKRCGSRKDLCHLLPILKWFL